MKDYKKQLKRILQRQELRKIGEREQLLEDIVLAIDEMEESRRLKRDERAALEERLQETKEFNCNMEVSRTSSTLAKDSGEGGMPTSEKRNFKRHLFHGTSVTLLKEEEEGRELLRQHIAQRREAEVKRLRIVEDQLSFQHELSD